MSKQLYEVLWQELPLAESQLQDKVPLIVEYTPLNDPDIPQEPIPWREAKKRVRAFYTAQAASLRTITETSLFPPKKPLI